MASEEPLFDPALKKKSKKKVTLDVDAELGLDTPAAAAPAAPVVDKLNPAPAPSAGGADDDDEEGGAGGADGRTADDDLAEMFGGLKKKKKSAVKKRMQFSVDLEKMPAPRTQAGISAAEKERGTQAAAAAAAAANAPGTGTATPIADEAAPAAEGGDELNFGELKKKKKGSSSKGAKKLAELEQELAAAEAAEGEDNEDDDDDDVPGDGVDRTGEGDLGDDVFAQGGDDGADDAAPAAGAGADAPDAWLGSDRDYHYQELLGRIFKTLRAYNPALSGDKKKYTIVPPSVQREGSKKTMFANSLDICKRMHREPEHVYSFLFAELGTIGNVDGNQRLIIKGRFQPKQIENVLRKYIVEYVTCKTCKSPNTTLSRKDRIYFMTCATCGSTRSVSAVKTGFQAIIGKRSKLRAAAAA